MKKLIAILLILSNVFLLPSCENNSESGKDGATGNTEQVINGPEQEDELPPSEGLEYELNESGDGYIVVGIGECTDTEVRIPDTYEGLPVVEIGAGAFGNNRNIKEISIPASVKEIGMGAFVDSTINKVKIPDSVTTIAANTFADCASLQNVTIPNSVTTIDKSAFSGCNSLQDITIPESVTVIGASAFRGCSSLQNIIIPNGVQEIKENAFNSCYSLQSITIPNSVTSIGENAISSCSSLTSISIPEGITTIGRNTFEYCDKLSSITIPVSVTVIAPGAFGKCNSITDVYYGGTEEQWNNIDIYLHDTWSGNDALLSATIHYNSAK